MFYCDECAKRNRWAADWYLPKSRGPCEMCGKVRACTDGPGGRIGPANDNPDDEQLAGSLGAAPGG